MGIYSRTLLQLVESVCKICLNDWIEGTATGGSTSTVVDTSRLERNSYFSDMDAEVYIITAGNAAAVGNTRKITSDVTGTLTVSPNFDAAIQAGDTYSIHINYPRDEVVENINLAIDMVAEEALVWKVDETSITLVAATYEYDIPASFMVIYRVTMADSDGNFDAQSPIPPDHWGIVHSATPQLRLHQFPKFPAFDDHPRTGLWAETRLTATRKLRIEGLASPATLSSDSATCPITPAYIVFQAGALCHTSRISRPPEEHDWHRVQSQVWQSRADIARQRVVGVKLPGNSKRVRE